MWRLCIEENYLHSTYVRSATYVVGLYLAPTYVLISYVSLFRPYVLSYLSYPCFPQRTQKIPSFFLSFFLQGSVLSVLLTPYEGKIWHLAKKHMNTHMRGTKKLKIPAFLRSSKIFYFIDQFNVV